MDSVSLSFWNFLTIIGVVVGSSWEQSGIFCWED